MHVNNNPVLADIFNKNKKYNQKLHHVEYYDGK